MVLRFSPFDKRPRALRRDPPSGGKRLRIEPLESRAMLSGVVDIVIGAGTLVLDGDGSNNQVELRQTNNPGEYFISSPDNTLFTINGVGATMPSATVNGINDDIIVQLDDGNDSFSFLGVAPGVQSTAPDDLIIVNSDGSNVNVISDVLVNGDLTVIKGAASSGYSELRIVNSRVIGDTLVDNTGIGTGDSKTVIDNSHLQAGGPGAYGLYLYNASGDDLFDALGNSQFGTGSFVAGQPVVYIYHGEGGSRTTFTGANQVAGPGTTTIYGRLEVENTDNLPGTLDMLTFNSVNVLGAVTVQNGDGDTETITMNSTLGSDFVPPLVGTGGSFRVYNDAGYDMFDMTDSLVPWGLKINNDRAAAGNSTWGSSTQITGSTIVTHPPGSALSNPDDAFQFRGDDGADVVNLIETTLGGIFDARMFDGNNHVTLLGAVIAGIDLVTGVGNDTLDIDDTQIIAYIDIFLDAGADELSIHNMNYATQWPNPLLAFVEIDADFGVDTFSGVVPPADLFAGFDLFVP
jgi:hypothetical protein